MADQVIFAEREPTEGEIEKLRLLLSTFQDGSGRMLKGKIPSWMLDNHALTVPDWRDFERAVALAYDGFAPENKGIYDVLLSDSKRQNVNFGISCKTKSSLLTHVIKRGQVWMELTNAAKGLWDSIIAYGLNRLNYMSDPVTVGRALIENVESAYRNVALSEGGNVDGSRSLFLTLQYELKNGYYQLLHFSVDLPKPGQLIMDPIIWTVKRVKIKSQESHAKTI